MNNNILNIIKETINDDIDSLYYTIWICVLDQFKHNLKRDTIVLSLMKENEDYYKIVYYNGKSIVEIVFRMNKLQKEKLYNHLINDGFDANDKTIKISRKTINSYLNTNKDKTKRKMSENTRNI